MKLVFLILFYPCCQCQTKKVSTRINPFPDTVSNESDLGHSVITETWEFRKFVIEFVSKNGRKGAVKHLGGFIIGNMIILFVVQC